MKVFGYAFTAFIYLFTLTMAYYFLKDLVGALKEQREARIALAIFIAGLITLIFFFVV